MADPIFNVKDSSTQVLMSKYIKENVFLDLLHRNGKGITEQFETNVSSLRIIKPVPIKGDARTIGASTNGDYFNNKAADNQVLKEYPLNLLHVYDKIVDIPEVQQSMVPVNLMEEAIKNISGRISTEINASTFAYQLSAKFNQADTDASWDGNAVVIGTGTKKTYEAVQKAAEYLDNGDEENGILSFPFDNRELIIRPTMRTSLMSEAGVLIGGSNYAQSMLAKGTISPETFKDFGKMYIGEIDATPVYLAPNNVWKRAGEWVGSATAYDLVQGMMVAAIATDRGISMLDYVKAVDAPGGAGIRLQPLTRWGVNVAFPKGVIPILANGTTVPESPQTVTAPGSV